MWDFLKALISARQLKNVSRGTLVAFAVLGAASLPGTYYAAKSAYDEFRATKQDIQIILTSINGINTKLEVSANAAADRDRRITQVEEVNQVQGNYISRFAEHIARLEGEIGSVSHR